MIMGLILLALLVLLLKPSSRQEEYMDFCDKHEDMPDTFDRAEWFNKLDK